MFHECLGQTVTHLLHVDEAESFSDALAIDRLASVEYLFAFTRIKQFRPRITTL